MSNISFDPDQLFRDLSVYGGTTINNNFSDCINTKTVQVENNTIFEFDDFTITGAELKICMKTLLEITKERNPEEFI
jgi:hypothetical protein